MCRVGGGGRGEEKQGRGFQNMFLILAIDKCCAHCAKISIKFLLPDRVFPQASKKRMINNAIKLQARKIPCSVA